MNLPGSKEVRRSFQLHRVVGASPYSLVLLYKKRGCYTYNPIIFSLSCEAGREVRNRRFCRGRIPDFCIYGQGNASSHMHGSGTGCTTRLVKNVNQGHCIGSTYFTFTVFTVMLILILCQTQKIHFNFRGLTP